MPMNYLPELEKVAKNALATDVNSLELVRAEIGEILPPDADGEGRQAVDARALTVR